MKRASAKTSKRSAIRAPLQRRSQESLERVLEAGLEVLQEVGFEGFTIQDVSRRAEVSVGSIYARAPSKRALILAIYDRAMDLLAEKTARLEQATPQPARSTYERISMLVHDLAEVMLENASTLKVFMQRSQFDPEILRRGSERTQRVGEAFVAQVLAHRADISHPHAELAADVVFRFVYATIARRITHGTKFELGRDIADTDLVRELGTAAADYLLSKHPTLSTAGSGKARGRDR